MPMATSPTTKSVVYLGLDELMFDPENPRLPATVDGDDERQVLEWMLVDEGLIELIGSIAEQDYFPGEPVLVAPAVAGHTKQRFLVVEGNRRLAAVRLLADPALAPVRQQAVDRLAAEAQARPVALPAIVFDSRDEILDYLGYRHITGVKEWDPLAKARYLKQLIERAGARGESITKQQLARRIGSRADYVERLLQGLDVYDHVASRNFYGLGGVSEDTISFSVLTTALSYENIASFVGTDEDEESGEQPGDLKEDNLRDLVDWMFRKREEGKTVLGESRNLGQLAAVVQYPEARDALKAGVPLNDATLLTDEPLQAFRRAVRQATDKLKLARSMTHRIVSPTEADVKTLADLTNIARELAGVLRNTIDDVDPTL